MIYIGFGILASYMVSGPLAMTSGFLLMSAGIAIIIMRKSYRKENADLHSMAKRQKEELAEPLPSEGKFIRIVWNDSYLCGIPEIDEQHKKLFASGNNLVSAASGQVAKETVVPFARAIMDDILTHFATEEAALTARGIQFNERHKAAHRALLVRGTDILVGYEQGAIPVGNLVGFITCDVIGGHIVNEDMKFHASVAASEQRTA